MTNQMKTQIESEIIDGARVETWFDQQSRNWITQLLTPSGFQIGDSMFGGRRDSAEANHKAMIDEAGDRLANYTSRHI